MGRNFGICLSMMKKSYSYPHQTELIFTPTSRTEMQSCKRPLIRGTLVIPIKSVKMEPTLSLDKLTSRFISRMIIPSATSPTARNA